MTRYGMVIDTKKCVGCTDCVVACKMENDVPDGFCRDWVVESVRGVFPFLSLEFRSERCNHCANPACVRCCPTGASFQAHGGIVLVKPELCIGCQACVASCPYDARFVHPDGYVSKCTFCEHRVEKGEQPACVSVCPTECMAFGDLEDPTSSVSRQLNNRSSKTLIPEAGTDPKVYFLV